MTPGGIRTRDLNRRAVADLAFDRAATGIDTYRIYYYFFRYNTVEDSSRPHRGHGIDSASNRNENQEYFLGDKGGRCVGLTNLPPSCADCLEIWEP